MKVIYIDLNRLMPNQNHKELPVLLSSIYKKNFARVRDLTKRFRAGTYAEDLGEND
jgi:hypothetical protein